MGLFRKRRREPPPSITDTEAEAPEPADGQPIRRYGYLGESGEIRFNEGEPTELDENVLPDTDADPDDWDTPTRSA